MKIGEAARTSGLSAKMIRYYEAIGLLAAADRRSNGYRNYTPPDINRLRFIRVSRRCGFSLAETREMLDLWADHNRSGDETRTLALSKIAEVQERLKAINAMLGTLRRISRVSDS